jgi:hypothetical protein
MFDEAPAPLDPAPADPAAPAAPVDPAPAEPAPAVPAAVEPVPLVPALPELREPIPVEPLAEACVRMNDPDAPAELFVELAPPALADPPAAADCTQPVTVT